MIPFIYEVLMKLQSVNKMRVLLNRLINHKTEKYSAFWQENQRF